MRRLVENVGQERRQGLYHSKHNDCDIKKGHVERRVKGRTGYPNCGSGKE